MQYRVGSGGHLGHRGDRGHHGQYGHFGRMPVMVKCDFLRGFIHTFAEMLEMGGKPNYRWQKKM